jgi:hypothetical protein
MPKRVIVLTVSPQPIYKEDRKAAEAITPGDLVDMNATGDLVKQVTAAINVVRDVAVEREEMGKDIDVPYAINDTVKVASMHQGQKFLGWLAAGNNVTQGTKLESAGAGSFRILAAGVAVARAEESVNAVARSRCTMTWM